LARLKSQLATSSIRETDNPTWQVISQLIDFLQQSNIQLTTDIAAAAESTGEAGITELTGDVTAGPGSGSQVATIANDAVTTPKILDGAVTTPKIADDAVTTIKIANNAVTYAKIQQVTQTEVLLGNGDISAPADVQEIGLGDNLEIESGLLQIIPTGGTGVGLAHQVLSDTHSDSLPDDAVLGDLIYGGPGGDLPGTYAHYVALTSVVEDFEGIRFAYYLGFQGAVLGAGNQLWGYAPVLDYIDAPLPDTWLTWNILDFFAQTSVIEDFEGIRVGMIGGTPGGFAYITGNNFGYAASMLETIDAPDLANPSFGILWQRLPIGTAGQVLQPVDEIPTWGDNLDLAGDLDVGGDVFIEGSITQVDSILTSSIVTDTLTALASISTPIVNSHTLGVWTDVTFDAANFTANGGTTPTWTLTAPDQILFRYCFVGAGLMFVQIYLATTTVASVAGAVTELRVKIPASQIAVGTPAQLVGAQENGAAVFDVYAGTDPGVDSTLIFIRTFPVGAGRAFDQTANASYFGFTLAIGL
jgi:hypothetical protein